MGKGKSPGKWIRNLIFGKKSASKSNSSKKSDIFKPSSNKDVLGFSEVSVSDPTVDSLVISPPISGANNTKGVLLENAAVNGPSHVKDVLSNGDEEAHKPAIANSGSQDDPEKLKLTEAAIKVQAACRGYLARQEFQSLKGIIQLQTLIRGHLVRRQAVSALYCVKGIVKFQALARGYNVRLSDVGLAVKKIRKDNQCSSSIGAVTSAQAEELSGNVFVHKLLASSSYALPLSLNGDIGEPYLGWKWLNRWTRSHFWALLPKSKKLDTVSDEKNSCGQIAERGQVKRNTRKSPAVKAEDGSVSGSNKHKPRPKKDSNNSLFAAQEQPLKETEKSSLKKTRVQSISDRTEIVNEKRKQSTKKNSEQTVTDVSEQGPSSTSEKMKDSTVPKSKESYPEKGRETQAKDEHNDKPHNDPTAELQTSVKKIEDSTVPKSKESYPEKGLGTQAKDEHIDPTAVLQTSVKKMKDSTVPKSKESYPEKGFVTPAKEESNNKPHNDPTPVLKTSVKKFKDSTVRKSRDSHPEKGLGMQAKEENNNKLHDDPTAALQTSVKNGDEKIGASEDLNDGDKIAGNNCQRRASLPANFNDQDSELHNSNTPRLPSYMAPTESAKARLKGQGSPRFATDFIDKNSITRRHSLSSSLNSRSGSFSPRAEKLIAMSGRGVTRTDKSLSSSRDGTEKLTQPQWRR